MSSIPLSSSQPTAVHATASSSIGIPEATTFYSLIRASSTSLAITASDDSLRIFDPETFSLRRAFMKTHSEGGVTCVRAVDENIIATTGRDAVVRMWDSRVDAGKAVTELTTGTTHGLV